MRTESTAYRADPSAMKESANWAEEYRRDMSQCINDNPGSALLTAFGAGFGVGLAIGVSLAVSGSHHRPMSRRRRAEDIGHRILDSLQDYMPESVARHMG